MNDRAYFLSQSMMRSSRGLSKLKFNISTNLPQPVYHKESEAPRLLSCPLFRNLSDGGSGRGIERDSVLLSLFNHEP